MGFFDWFRKKPEPKALSYCVPESIYSAWLWGVRHKAPVRIAVSEIREGVDHAQAQALIEGSWRFLTPKWDHGAGRIKVVPWESHFPTIKPYRYLTLREWIDEQIGFVGA
jgi:hypothetical protein